MCQDSETKGRVQLTLYPNESIDKEFYSTHSNSEAFRRWNTNFLDEWIPLKLDDSVIFVESSLVNGITKKNL